MSRYKSPAVGDSDHNADPRNALIDLLELNKYVQGTLQAVGFEGLSLLRTWVDARPADSALRDELQSLGLVLAGEGLRQGSARNDVVLGNEAANSFDMGDCDDYLHGTGGDDALRGDAGAESLCGQHGHDDLCGGAGNNEDIGVQFFEQQPRYFRLYKPEHRMPDRHLISR